VILLTVGAVTLVAALVVGFGAYRELIGFPSSPVAYANSDAITLKQFSDTLTDEMRSLQSQISQSSNNPNQASAQIQELINAQEKLPETVLDKEIENSLVRQEAAKRGVTIPPSDVDNRINEVLSANRAIINAPTPTTTSTVTPTSTPTETPEGFDPTPTATRTETVGPGTPTSTLDPSIPTLTRTPFPTRPTATPIVTPTMAPTMAPNEYQEAYKSLQPQLRNESQYRRGIELELLRKKLRESLGASLPTSGPEAHVQRLVTSTKDEATVALIQINQDYPFEELAAQAAERPIQGLQSGDLGWVAKGAQTKEFDDLVFSNDTTLNEWSQPFQAGSHWEIVRVLERKDGPYDDQNLERMKDRRFQEWLDDAKQSQDIRRDLSPEERKWAVDRASKGIFQTDDGTGRTPRR